MIYHPDMHPDVPFSSTGSIGGWLACRECSRRMERGNSPRKVAGTERARVYEWHERIYSEMFKDWLNDFRLRRGQEPLK